jgi:hypothetical protein
LKRRNEWFLLYYEPLWGLLPLQGLCWHIGVVCEADILDAYCIRYKPCL